jgi:hypothetical protein
MRRSELTNLGKPLLASLTPAHHNHLNPLVLNWDISLSLISQLRTIGGVFN